MNKVIIEKVQIGNNTINLIEPHVLIDPQYLNGDTTLLILNVLQEEIKILNDKIKLLENLKSTWEANSKGGVNI